MTEQALTVSTPFEETMNLGTVLAQSGYFVDARDASQAVVKILAGRELGIGPIASMSGIHIVKGKPTIGANIIAALVKANANYDYHIEEHTDETCDITFYQGAQKVGHSRFTMADAKRAGLSGANWQKYPRAMLFARAISQGARFHCPDVFTGVTAYTPEELGAVVEENSDVVDSEVRVVEPEPAPEREPEKPNGGPARLLATVNAKCEDYYQHEKHLANTLQQLDPDWPGYPPASDRAAWNSCFTRLVTSAKQKQLAKEMAMDDAASNDPTETEIDPPGQEGD